MRSTSASSGAMSSPRCLAWPIALERALRSVQLLGTGLYRLALLFQRFDACDIQLEATGGQAGSHFLRLGAYQFGIEHALSSRVGYRRFVARFASAPATSSTPSRKPG